jgi:outer membrane murein-binding lipoprotein Lpp
VNDRIVSEHQQLADIVNRMEGRLMARIDDLQSALDTLAANVGDLASDVVATLGDLKAQGDAALANDAATIADLKAQLAAQSAGIDGALTKVQALNDAVANADVPVNRP